jgi:hypothetical protein
MERSYLSVLAMREPFADHAVAKPVEDIVHCSDGEGAAWGCSFSLCRKSVGDQIRMTLNP